MERVTGIEPMSVAWEATVLPLNYTRINVSKGSGRGTRTPKKQGITHLSIFDKIFDISCAITLLHRTASAEHIRDFTDLSIPT